MQTKEIVECFFFEIDRITTMQICSKIELERKKEQKIRQNNFEKGTKTNACVYACNTIYQPTCSVFTLMIYLLLCSTYVVERMNERINKQLYMNVCTQNGQKLNGKRCQITMSLL